MSKIETMLASLILLVSALASPSFSSAQAALPPQDALFERVDGDSLLFKPAGAIKTGLLDLKYLGKMPAKAVAGSYFVVSGRPCQNCIEDQGIYLIHPTLTAQQTPRLQKLVYPGRILDPKTRAAIFESRAFLGKCLYRSKGDVYVVFQKDLAVGKRRKNQSSVLLIEPGEHGLDERLLEKGLPRLQDTLKLVKAKSCSEIDGRNRVMVKRPLDTSGKKVSPDAAEPDDDDDELDKKSPESPADTSP